MIGFWDYTVWLTYLSLLSAFCGVLVTLHGNGHPFMGAFFLMFCGLCDSFDGMVARTKKDRSQMAKDFGVQIDSLADLVAFGFLPAAIGDGMLRAGAQLSDVPHIRSGQPTIFLFAIMMFYVLAAMVRLAYFNVTEEERQKMTVGSRKYYIGLPVTISALIFPTVLLFQYVLPQDVTYAYFAVLLITGLLFLGKFRVPKPKLKEILVLVGIGGVEFVILLILRMIISYRGR